MDRLKKLGNTDGILVIQINRVTCSVCKGKNRVAQVNRKSIAQVGRVRRHEPVAEDAPRKRIDGYRHNPGVSNRLSIASINPSSESGPPTYTPRTTNCIISPSPSSVPGIDTREHRPTNDPSCV